MKMREKKERKKYNGQQRAWGEEKTGRTSERK